MKKGKQHKWLAPVIAGIAVLTMVSGGLAGTGRKAAGKTVVVEILEGYVSLQDVAVEPGTTIVWRNETDKTVNVNFTMGQQVTEACRKPSGFELDIRGGYAAANIPAGQTVSLCFPKLGAFQYLVDIPGGFGGEGAPPPFGNIAVVRDLNYVAPETSWVEISAGWDVIPGLVEPPFSARGWAPPSRKSTRIVKSN